MDFAAALFEHLSGDATVAAYVWDRIYPIMLPQNTVLPALVYREMYTDETHALQVDDKLRRLTFEIEAHGSSYAESRAAIRPVESALCNFSGMMGTCVVQAVLASGGAEDYDPDAGTYWKSSEFEFFVLEG